MHFASILAAAVSVGVIADADVLEPSVLNEVEHAIATVRTDGASEWRRRECAEFAALYATNGMDATARAIALVSSQRGGRWMHGGADVTPVALRLLRKAAGIEDPPLKLSVPAAHVERIEREEEISFADTAAKVRALGVGALDATDGFPAEKLAVARRLGFEVRPEEEEEGRGDAWLKDADADGKPVAIGAGVAPVARRISALLDAGYTGWFTVDLSGVERILPALEASAKFLRGGW